MKNMKAVPYIETRGSERFKEFLQTPFKISDVYKFKDIEAGVFSTEKGLYYRYSVLIGPIPTILNEFISDMKRIGINLEWKPEIVKDFEPKDYLPENEIRQYYETLLKKMNKGYELNGNEEKKY